MTSFDFQCATRIICGPEKVSELGHISKAIGGERTLPVSDPGIVAAGHAPRVAELLTTTAQSVLLFDGVEENPTTFHVENGLHLAREFRPDLIVAVGGGSSMDCAKGINFLYSCGGQMRDYWGEGKATGPLLPMIAVPTTAGTGSETQSYALISDADSRVKMACGDKRASFRAAILDPQLTLTQPARVTALTGIDALSHAVESFVTKRRNAISVAFSREAWRRLAPNFSRVLSEPQNLAVRARMQTGACLAGLAIENSMLGAAHSLANPLTAAYELPHGEAVALMLPHVIRFNGPRVAALYHELLTTSGPPNLAPSSVASAPEALADLIVNFGRVAGMAARLSDCGIEYQQIPRLAEEASRQWTAKFNPIEVTAADCQKLYERAY